MSYLAELQEQRKQCEDLVKMGEALQRLYKNRDFKQLIEVQYLREEAIRLVQAAGNPRLNNEQREMVQRDIYAISSFTQYLDSIALVAGEAVDKIKQIDEAIAESMGESMGDEE